MRFAPATRMQLLIDENNTLRAQHVSRAATQATINELLRDKLRNHIEEQKKEQLFFFESVRGLYELQLFS